MRLKHDRMSIMLRSNTPVTAEQRSAVGSAIQAVGVALMLIYLMLQFYFTNEEMLKRQALYTFISVLASMSYLWHRQMVRFCFCLIVVVFRVWGSMHQSDVLLGLWVMQFLYGLLFSMVLSVIGCWLVLKV